MMKRRQACEVNLCDLGRVGLVSFQGSGLMLDEVEAELLEDRLAEWTEALDRPEWLIDFTGVEYLTSRMLATLVTLHGRLRARDSRLRLCGLADQVYEVFAATRLNGLLDIDRREGPAR